MYSEEFFSEIYNFVLFSCLILFFIIKCFFCKTVKKKKKEPSHRHFETTLTITIALSIADSGPKPDTPISILTSAPDLKVTPFPVSEDLTRLLKLRKEVIETGLMFFVFITSLLQ